MRDYLYIPLGGNRVHPSRLYLNLWTVFLLSGLWHGAAWTLVAWGAYHGLWLVLERLVLLRIYRRLGPLSILPTFAITVVGWVLFRASTLAGGLAYVGRMLGQHVEATMDWNNTPLATPSWEIFDTRFWLVLALGLLFAFMNGLPGLERRNLSLYAAHTLSLPRSVAFGLVTALLLVLSFSSIISNNFNPFIYFRF